MTRMRRQMPRLGELAPFLRPAKPKFNALEHAHTIAEIRRLARRHTPKGPFDYADGAADDEIGDARARAALDAVEFHPRVLVDVADVDPSVSILGQRSALPFGCAPTGFTRMMHAAGEPAVARAAAAAGIPYTLSTVGTTSVSELAAAVPTARKWFQLYPFRDRELTERLLHDAAAHGYDTLMVTVDCPVAGNRLRDVRNGMTIPPAISLKTVLDASIRPRWWFDFLTTEPYKFAFEHVSSLAMTDLSTRIMDSRTTYADIVWIRAHWRGALLVKGVLDADDAARLVEIGADGVVVSDHGGRQLDRSIAPLHALPAIRRRLGRDAVIMYDGGIRNGADIIAALASGADFALIGRAYLYGLMAGGEEGVARALEILRTELVRTMRLLGVPTIGDLSRAHIGQIVNQSPRKG